MKPEVTQQVRVIRGTGQVQMKIGVKWVDIGEAGQIKFSDPVEEFDGQPKYPITPTEMK